MKLRLDLWITVPACAMLCAAMALAADPPSPPQPVLNVGGIEQADTGSIRGIVKIKGDKPERQAIRGLNVDAYCANCWRDREPMLSEDYVWGDDDTLQNVVVYVSKGLPDKPAPQLTELTRLNLAACRFAPHVLAMQTGQPLEIHNSDDTLHAIRFRSEHNGSFNDDLIKGVVLQRQFTTPELGARFTCRAHRWERAYLAIFDHPYFAVTQKDGSFQIKGLPPGEYQIATWHEMESFKPDKSAYKVTVPKEGEGEVTITYILPPRE